MLKLAPMRAAAPLQHARLLTGTSPTEEVTSPSLRSRVHRRAKEEMELQTGAARATAQINLGSGLGRDDDGDGAKCRGEGPGDRGCKGRRACRVLAPAEKCARHGLRDTRQPSTRCLASR